jgi:ribosomal protein S18 acetylase RimI-like enzyme
MNKPCTLGGPRQCDAMNIRQLTPQDAADFQRLRLLGLREEPSAFASSYEEEKDRPLSAIETQLAPSPDHAIFGAFAGNALVGVVALGREGMHKLAHKGYIWGMFVAASVRQQGVGRLLMLETISMARTAPGLRQLNLGVNANNTAAIWLYESLGFKAFGREAGAMLIAGTLHDEVHMSLRLNAD